MFVEQQRLRRNPKSTFLQIGSVPRYLPQRSQIKPKGCTPILDRCCNPKGRFRIQTLFEMQQEKKFVPGDAVRITVTPAQKALLDLLSHPNAPDYSQFLKEVHELGTYYPEKDLVNLTASLHVHWLQQAIAAIAEEHFTNSKQA